MQSSSPSSNMQKSAQSKRKPFEYKNRMYSKHTRPLITPSQPFSRFSCSKVMKYDKSAKKMFNPQTLSLILFFTLGLFV
jgi:hypothetical protein